MAPDKKKEKKKEETGPVTLSGVYMFANGDKYDGEYSRSSDSVLQRNGTGCHVTTDGTVYTGSWADDKMTGHGRLEHPSGAVFEGDFVNNKFHGKGKYVWPNGSYYEGQFVENRMEGDGKFTDTDGQVWSGTFRYKAAPGLRFQVTA